ncbi:MAG: hypothetical protein Kow0075_07460 [Salibacteraceae bacterium]
MSRDIVLYGLIVAVFSAFKLIEATGGELWPLASSYLEDLLALPIMLKSAELLIRTLFRNVKYGGIGWPNTIAITLVISIWFEVYMPHVDQAFTADPLDVLCYWAGAVFYRCFLLPPGLRSMII